MSSGTWSRVMKGWLAGCLAATAVLGGVAWIIVVIAAIASGDLGQFMGATIMVLLSTAVAFVLTCLLTGLPAAVMVWLSERFAIRSIWFFGCAGAVTGVLGEAILIGSFGRVGPSYFTGLFVVAGFVAGLAYWRVSGRHAGG